MSYDPKSAAHEIMDALRAGRNGETKELEVPGILTETPPEDKSRLVGWKALRDQTEQEYVNRLLGKSSLSAREAQFLSTRVGRFLRGE